jgi:hypothetical protein
MRRRVALKGFVLPLVGVVALGGSGCFVTPREEQAVVTFTLDVPSSSYAAGSGSGSTPWDGMDRFHLDTFPKYVRVALEYKDWEDCSGGWPDPRLGIGGGEGPDGEVEVTLECSTGTDRLLRALGFVADAAGVMVYQEEQVQQLSLTAGQSQDLTVKMLPAKTGTVDLNVRCQGGTGEDWAPVRVSLVDARAQVVFPAVALEKKGDYLQKEIHGVPVGRYLATDVVLRHQVTGQEAQMQVIKPTYVVEAAGDRVAVNLVTPCTF